MYDEVRIYFQDGKTSLIFVGEDEDIQQEIAYFCEAIGYDPVLVTGYKILRTVQLPGPGAVNAQY